MSERTEIEWADHTWSPWRGCTNVSPGCANCYAETLSRRNPAVLGSWGKGAPRVISKSWGLPHRWNLTPESELSVRPTVFPSLCDWLDDDVPIEWLARFLELIHATPNLSWLLLTKRPENWKRVDEAWRVGNLLMPVKKWLARWHDGNAPDNVWFGVSVEDQTRAIERIPRLINIPAAIRWVSIEPLLGPVDMERIVVKQSTGSDLGMVNALTGRQSNMGRPCPDVPRINWIVIGGESGNRARPCNIRWIQNLLRQTREAGTPTFVKQLGARPIWLDTLLWDHAGRPKDWYPRGVLVPMKVCHSKGGDPVEWPEEVRVREFPWLCIGESAENGFGWLRNKGALP